MSRKLIITRKQLDEICGGNSEYFDELTSKPDLPSNIYANQITTGNLPDGYAKPVTGDDVRNRMSRDAGMFGSGRITNRGMSSSIYYESKRPNDDELEFLVEINSELKNQNITAVVGNGDNKYKVSGKEGALATQKTRAKQAGDKEKEKALEKALDIKRKPIEQRKKNKHNMGMPNAYQKPGGSKQSGNGKAHTPKNNITYFN